MSCPQCQSDEISSSGICMVCGFQIPANSSTPEPEFDGEEALEETLEEIQRETSKETQEESRSYSGMIEMNYTDSTQVPAPKEELPQWRKELSERLQAIKQKKEAAVVPVVQRESKVSSFSASQAQVVQPPPVQPLPVVPAKPVEKPQMPKPAPKPMMPAPRQKVLQPMESESVAAKPVLKTPDPQEIQNMIDNAVSRQSAAVGTSSSIAETPISAPVSAQEPFVDQEGKLILLSRTLAGLVDLIFVVLCTGAFIIAADFFSGIVVLDSISYAGFSVLFLLNYFIYSIFFLATSSQTVGMMITDLRVVGADDRRPSLRQLLRRCGGYLISVLGLGIGLLWSLFNRDSLCLHDLLSDTHVIRI